MNSNPEPASDEQRRTAYVTCPSCRGSGMQDYMSGPGDCQTCGTDTVVRARDEHGRFATVEAKADV